MPRTPLIRTLVTLAATALLTLTATTAVAVDADSDIDDAATGTETAPLLATAVGAAPSLLGPAPDYDTCRYKSSNLGGTCFQWVGDDQWVFDGWTNGWATVVHVNTNYGKDRYCQALPSAQGWAKCNYDHREDKCVRFRMYELKDGTTRNWTDWSPWYGADYGWPC
jgi:hypothetical protein